MLIDEIAKVELIFKRSLRFISYLAIFSLASSVAEAKAEEKLVLVILLSILCVTIPFRYI